MIFLVLVTLGFCVVLTAIEVFALDARCLAGAREGVGVSGKATLIVSDPIKGLHRFSIVPEEVEEEGVGTKSATLGGEEVRSSLHSNRPSAG